MALFSPLVLDYTEMMLAGGAWQLQHNGLTAAYAPPLTPYHMSGVQYPPLFFSLMTLFSWLTGFSPIVAARFWSYFGYVAAAIMVGLLIHQESQVEGRKSKVEEPKTDPQPPTPDPRPPAFSSFVFLPFCFWPVIIFIHTARVDPLALFFSLLGVWVYRRGKPDSQKIAFARLILVAAILALAVFTKQTYLVAPAAIFFHLLIAPQNRLKALGFGISYAGIVGLGYGLFGLLSGGEFWGIFEAARASRFIFDLAPGIVAFFVVDHLPLLIIALIMLVWQWRQGQRFYPLYAFLAVLSCIAIVKDGAIDYYFTELAYIVVIQVGIAVQAIENKGTNHQDTKTPRKYKITWRAWRTWRFNSLNVADEAGTVVSWLIFFQCLIAIGMLVGWSQTRATDNFRVAYNEGVSLVTQANAQNQPALILADGLLIETGQYQKVGDYLIYSILLSSGSRDVSPLLTDLQTQHWQLIITVDPKLYRWSAEIGGLLEKNYNLKIIRGADGTGLYWAYQVK